jgi:hypothetical protein
LKTVFAKSKLTTMTLQVGPGTPEAARGQPFNDLNL